MRINFLFIIAAIILNSCQNAGSGRAERLATKLNEKIISVSEDYINSILKDQKKTISQTGVITIGDDKKRYLIDPAKIFPGLIDDDNSSDAIVTIYSFKGNYLDLIEHLIIINTNGKLKLTRVIESDIKILSLDKRIITAELPTHPRSSPLFNCPSCREIVKYQFINGDLIRKE